MTTFHVHISRDRTESKVVEVIADTERAAEKNAKVGAWSKVVSDWEAGGDTDGEYVSDIDIVEVGDKKLFQIHIAQYIQTYGYVDVTAANIEEAVEKVDGDYVYKHFTPNGAGDDDFDYGNTLDVFMTEWTDEEGNGGELAKEVTDDEPPTFTAAGRSYRPTVMMHGLVEHRCGTLEHNEHYNTPSDAYEVWLRRDYIEVYGDQEPFDAAHSQRFKTFDEAAAYENALAKGFECEMERY